MKRRIISILLTVFMVVALMPTAAFAGTVTNYGIWVGATEVTSANMEGVTGAGITGTVTYDAATNTLTLNNANITKTNNYNFAISSEIIVSKDLNINLVGSNTITVDALTNTTYGVNAIYSYAKVNMKGSDGSSLSVSTPFETTEYKVCIYGREGVTIEDCTVTATTGNTTGNKYNPCTGINIESGTLSIKNATVTAITGNTSGNSYGINVRNSSSSITIKNSTVTAIGGDGKLGSNGIYFGGSITIEDSTVTAKGKTQALYFYNTTPTLAGLVAVASADIEGSSAAAVTLDTGVYGLGSTYKYVKIAPALPESQARWGLTDIHGSAPTAWTQGTLADAISFANTGKQQATYVQLLTDINQSNHSTWPLTFNNTINPTFLDLNGKNIDRGLQNAAANGNVITANSLLTIKDSSTLDSSKQGRITGGYNSDDTGGGLYVNNKGSIILQGGNITGNKTKGKGGGVKVDEYEFLMQGGSITGNEASGEGGAVYAQGTFIMKGGSITGNIGQSAGVCFRSSFTVGGTAVIQDNTVTGSGVERNVLVSGQAISVFSSMPPTSGASIGVTTNPLPTSGSPRNVTGTNSAIYSSYFFSDNSSYIIKNGTSNVVQLAVSSLVGNTTALTLTATPDGQQTLGNPVTLTATLTGFLADPGVSGQAIMFHSGGVPIGVAGLNTAGVAVFPWTPPGTGTYSLTAGYYGSLNNAAATSSAVNYTVVAAPSSGGGSSTSSRSPEKTAIVVVNGQEQNAGKESNQIQDGKSTVIIEVKNEVIDRTIDEAIKNNTTGTNNVMKVPVADKKTESAKVELTGDIVKKLEQNKFDVSVKWDTVEYVIPAEDFTISKAAESLGVKETDLKEIRVDVKITKLNQVDLEKYSAAAKNNGSELVFPPVTFEVVANTTKADGSTVELTIDEFSNYVERVIELPGGVDSGKITTGIVFNPDGTYSHVPTFVFQKDGKWYAKINSLTNSTYSVIWNPVAVKSVEKHWSKDTVNELASRLVVFNTETFAPDKAITRADFAEYIIKALGLYRQGSGQENNFKDVSAKGDRTLAVLIASEYGIVSGYPDGTFRPDALITRQEAMTMYQRAMKVTKLTGTDPSRYQSYQDYDIVSKWASNYVKEVLSAHVFNGTTATTISPKSNLTYAEAATAIKNLLVESELINK